MGISEEQARKLGLPVPERKEKLSPERAASLGLPVPEGSLLAPPKAVIPAASPELGPAVETRRWEATYKPLAHALSARFSDEFGADMQGRLAQFTNAVGITDPKYFNP